MSDSDVPWRREQRPVPPGVTAEAASHPGGSVAAIDGSMVSDSDGYVPVEAIIGRYLVDPNGVATGEFIHNPRYGPIRDDYELLESLDHWLGWLPGTPRDVLRNGLEGDLSGQVAGSRVEWLKVIEDPVFLTGGVRDPDQPSMGIVRRAAMAVPFALAVAVPVGERWILTGVYSWVAVSLDKPSERLDRTWLDLGASREWAAEALERRIYELSG